MDINRVNNSRESARRLFEFLKSSKTGEWPISNDQALNALFNQQSLASWIDMAPRFNRPSYLIRKGTVRLNVLVKTRKGAIDLDQRVVQPSLASRMYARNYLHANTLLHFLLGICLSGVYSAEEECAVELAQKLIPRLTGALHNYSQCTFKFGREVIRAGTTVGMDSGIFQFGHIYHLYSSICDEFGSVSAANDACWFKSHLELGPKGLIDSSFTNSPVSRFFEFAADNIEHEVGSKFAREHFAQYGLIPANQIEQRSFNAAMLQDIGTRKAKLHASGLSGSPSKVAGKALNKAKVLKPKLPPIKAIVKSIAEKQKETIPASLGVDLLVPLPVTTGRQKGRPKFVFQTEYEKLIGSPSTWTKEFRSRVESRAEDIIARVSIPGGCLGSKLVDLVGGIPCPSIEEALVARKVVFWVSLKYPNKNDAEVVLGYPERPPRKLPQRKEKSEAVPVEVAKDEERKPDTREYFNKCLREWGLTGLKFPTAQDYPGWTEYEREHLTIS